MLICNKHIKTYLTSLVIRKMQNKTTMKYYFTSTQVDIIAKVENNTSCGGCGETGTLMHCSWECKMVQLLCKTI
jgi:hypothetical protein